MTENTWILPIQLIVNISYKLTAVELHFYKNIHTCKSIWHKKFAGTAPLILRKINGAVLANILCQIDFQICSNKKWTLGQNSTVWCHRYFEYTLTWCHFILWRPGFIILCIFKYLLLWPLGDRTRSNLHFHW